MNTNFFQISFFYAIVVAFAFSSIVRGLSIKCNKLSRIDDRFLKSRLASRTKTTFSVHHQLHSTNSVDTEDDDLEAKNEVLRNAANNLDVRGVTLKMAFDTSYAVADSSENKSERFTCPESLDMVHKLRRWSDAVLVGRGTVQRDDCTLTVRRVPLLPQSQCQPVRVVIDPSLKIIGDNYEYAMLKDGHKALIYHCTDKIAESGESKFFHENVELVKVSTEKNSSTDSKLSVKAILHDLSARNIHHVMVEGGPETAKQFLKHKLVDRAILVRAPVTFIEPVPSGMSDEMMAEAGLTLSQEEKSGDDTIEYWSKDGAPWPSVNEALEDIWPY